MILTNRNIHLAILALLPLLPLHPLFAFMIVLLHCFTKNVAVNQFAIQLLILIVFKAMVIILFENQWIAAFIDIIFVYSSMMILWDEEVILPWLTQTCSYLIGK